jgi:hypothetical protein
MREERLSDMTSDAPNRSRPRYGRDASTQGLSWGIGVGNPYRHRLSVVQMDCYLNAAITFAQLFRGSV